ncbi:MAG: hypothetical protein WBG43_00130 [Marinifilaceae bacterium]
MKLLKSSVIISFISILIGIALNMVFPIALSMPVFPNNMYLGAFGIVIMIILNLLSKNRRFKFLASYELAISSLINIILIILILGLVPQDGKKNSLVGFSNLHSTPLVHLSIFIFLYSLSVIIKNRITKRISIKNMGFIMNHIGIFLVVFFIYVGHSDLKKVQLKISKNEGYLNKGINKLSKESELPFKIELEDFDINEYTPQIAIVESSTNKISIKIENNLSYISNNYDKEIMGWNVKVKKFIPYSIYNGSVFKKSKKENAAPSAFFEIINKETKERKTGWISCGSKRVPLAYMKLNEEYNLMMIKPKVREYVSTLNIVVKSDTIMNIPLKVNHPISIGDWDIYQLSYNTEKGKWSDFSIIEAVYDPWIKYVYTGVFMLLLGSFILLKKRIY